MAKRWAGNRDIQPLMQNVISKYRHPGGQTPPQKTQLAVNRRSVGKQDDVDEKVALMRERYENGLDLWTGEPLDEVKPL